MMTELEAPAARCHIVCACGEHGRLVGRSSVGCFELRELQLSWGDG